MDGRRRHGSSGLRRNLILLIPRTFVGSGKAEEIAGLARSYAADVVIFDDELTPSQQSNLEKVVGKRRQSH